VESLASYHTPLLYASALIAFAGVGLAVFLYGGPASRVQALAAGAAPVHRLLEGKYFVDELYDRVLVRPLVWLSEHVLLRGSDRLLLDGTLNGLGALAQRTASALGRAQSGSLQWYTLLVLVGMVGALLWSWRHV
jgi:NADH-quinone oxidoreductase subunit L